MKYCLVYLLLGFFLFSCGKKHDDGAVSMSLEKRDSLLIEYIVKGFDYDWDPGLYEISKRRFKTQLNNLRNNPGYQDYTHQAEFKEYNLKSFLFDSQGKSPFVVEITNKKDEFISFFTYTDEKFYSSNTISRERNSYSSPEKDSVLQEKINFEKNLNQLVEILNLNDAKEILDFTKTLCDLLEMQVITQDSIQNEIKSLCANTDLAWGDSICNLVYQEQKLFFEKGKGDVFMARTQYYLGYWRFWIEENERKFKIRVAFFSDILYTPIYM